MAVNTLPQLLLIVLVGNMAINLAKGKDIPRQSVNADIVSLKEYGIVFKPGRLMSTSDVTHIQQGFVIEIPHRKRREELATAAEELCEEVWKTTSALERQHDDLIRDTHCVIAL